MNRCWCHAKRRVFLGRPCAPCCKEIYSEKPPKKEDEFNKLKNDYSRSMHALPATGTFLSFLDPCLLDYLQPFGNVTCDSMLQIIGRHSARIHASIV
jgi:hypothetical protein